MVRSCGSECRSCNLSMLSPVGGAAGVRSEQDRVGMPQAVDDVLIGEGLRGVVELRSQLDASSLGDICGRGEIVGEGLAWAASAVASRASRSSIYTCRLEWPW